ncbi:Thiol-activated cytolysin [Pedobacter steynii]|uniref:Thiol-activated cytolysin n=1 Tax=Pedobacter steynii TaxID=430522 RepID=A0A1H0CGS3_9SPHI|nr:hypothetical protein [Pedobacter steynii]NQX41563.1 hypothetical protein [Pedobacter steynii]SDN57033.1 Thiol-activated cytolysin [Pedobacter steynii]
MSIACKKAPKHPETGTPPVIVVPKDTTKKDTTKVIVQPKRLKIDSIRKDLSGRSIIRVMSDSVWRDSTGVTFFVELKDYPDISTIVLGPVADDSQVYPGALIKGKSLADFSFKALTGYALAPVDVLPSDWSFDLVDNMPISKKSMEDYIKKQMTRGGTRKVHAMAGTIGEPFENYAEISLNQRHSWDFSNLLNVKPGENRRIKKKTGLYSSATLRIFGITTYPKEGKFFAPEVNPASIPDEPLVVRDVTYGRTATIAIESDAPFAEIKSAFNAAEEKSLNASHRSLLQNATITIFVRGFSTGDTNHLKSLRGAEQVEKYFAMIAAANTVSVNDYGAPVELMTSNATSTDNSFHRYQYKYRLDYPIK